MRKSIRRLLVVLGATAAALVLMEAAVRVLDLPPRPVPPLAIADYRLSDDPVIDYEYLPGRRTDAEHIDASHRGFAINAAGFRDRDYPERKPAGTFRVLVLGDSTTAGNGVEDAERTYPKILERLLDGVGAPGAKFEVLNMGVGGYHTMQEAATLRAKGLKYEPDAVLLTVCLNDFDLHGDGGVHDRLVALNRGVARGGCDGLLRASRLAFFVHHRLRAAPSESKDAYETDVLHGGTTVRAGFALLSELQQRHGFATLVFVLPTFSHRFDSYPHVGMHQMVRDSAQGLPGLAVVDLLPAFAGLGVDPRRLSTDGLHMNERGHEAMARMLLPRVERIAADASRRAGR